MTARQRGTGEATAAATAAKLDHDVEYILIRDALQEEGIACAPRLLKQVYLLHNILFGKRLKLEDLFCTWHDNICTRTSVLEAVCTAQIPVVPGMKKLSDLKAAALNVQQELLDRAKQSQLLTEVQHLDCRTALSKSGYRAPPYFPALAHVVHNELPDRFVMFELQEEAVNLVDDEFGQSFTMAMRSLARPVPGNSEHSILPASAFQQAYCSGWAECPNGSMRVRVQLVRSAADLESVRKLAASSTPVQQLLRRLASSSVLHKRVVALISDSSD